MNRWLIVASLLLAACLHQSAAGHGDAIQVGLATGKLTVGHVPNSFPPLVMGQDDVDGRPDDSITDLPGIGEIVYWDVPGFEISGLDNASSLSIEPRAVAVKNAIPAKNSLVWYWNPLSHLVEQSPRDFKLVGTGLRSVTLPAAGETSLSPFLLTSSLSGHQGFHDHGLLSYALDNDPTAPDGVYGIFARLTSNQYQPSDTFLVLFNNNVSFSNMVPAAAAITAAASTAAPLLGDYNHNGIVDAADYNVWRDSLGSTTMLAADGSGNLLIDTDDYTIWRNNFGHSGGSGSTADIKIGQAVAEPNGVSLALCASLGVLARLAIYRRRGATAAGL